MRTSSENIRAAATRIFALATAAVLALGLDVALAQENGEDDADADSEALELQDVRVTGSRLNRPPSELSGNLIVLDQDDIRASGELTLARVLRQLPQNINATDQTWGSTLNGTTNLTGASTVNLRGLGSEYTLILVDGRRVGYSGITGGVTDVSTIPLSLVDRIEVYLDGASAIYGSDAVGGVVNIITRKDYQGVELDINYGRPHKSGYDETRVNLSTGLAWNGGRANIGYEYFRDSGLDASSRDSIIHANRNDTGPQQRGLPGPQVRLFSWFFDRSCDAAKAVVYELDGAILSRAEFAALDAEAQAMATCHADITVPSGFMPGDDLNGIEIFGAAEWGEDAELGSSLRPDQNHHTFRLGIDHDLTTDITAHVHVRWLAKENTRNSGIPSFNGFLHANSPYNPFGVRVIAFAQVPNAAPTHSTSDEDGLFAGLGLEGTLGDSWLWQTEFNRSKTEIDVQRFNVLDGETVRNGMNSDGVSEAIIGVFSGIDEAACEAKQMEIGGTRYRYSSFFGGNCSVYGAPPEPINPFGDLTAHIAPGLTAGSINEQTQFEALARGELFNAPGGAVALVVGYDYREDVLDSFSEFHATGGMCSLVACPDASPAGSEAFNTSISRTLQAGFFEGLIPLVGPDNAKAGVQRLNLTFSGRYDSYSDVEVEFRNSQSGEAASDNPQDPGGKFTYSTGLVYQINESLRLKARQGTSFVAPQLNQLIKRTQDRAPQDSFNQLCLLLPDGSGCRNTNNTWAIAGANDRLVPETAETLSFTAEISPASLPGLSLRANWNDREIENRIVQLRGSRFGIDTDNLPGYIMYVPEDDIFLVDTRYINVGYIQSTGIDYELRYDWETGANEFSLLARRTYTNRYVVQLDPSTGTVKNLVETRDDTGPQAVRIIDPVSRHKTSAQFTWSNGGLFFSLDVESASRVSTLVSSTFEGITEPATLYDMVFGYEFGQDDLLDAPAWLQGWQVTLTINNLTDAFSKNLSLNPETGDTDVKDINPLFEWTQGRAYRLNIRKSFGGLGV